MQGVVFMGHRTLDLVSFPDPEPGPNDVVLEMKASGMCGSDLKFYRAAPGEATKALGLKETGEPIIAGHEPCGVVASVGSEVSPAVARPGDRVMVHHYKGCSKCPHCRTGWAQMCDEGATIYGVSGHGGHAAYMKVPASTLVHLPEELSFSTGAALSCGTGTAYGALVRMDVSARDTLVIFGQGPVGMSATILAAAMGARVIAVDVNAERVNRALSLGAAHAIDSSREDPVDAIMAFTAGKGANKIMDTSGSPVARAAAVRAAAKWGLVCLVGEGGEIVIDVSPQMIRKQLAVIGSWTFSTVGQADCARFVADRGLEIDALFSDRWTIDLAGEAYSRFDRGEGDKSVFLF